MQPTSLAKDWPYYSYKTRQHGQALIYGMFVLIGSLTGLFFLFNTGQLASEKTKLVNTADAVAYSAGVLHARALNFDSYNNRALVANEVLVAQLVSLSSWAQYATTHVERVPQVFPECASLDGAALDAFVNFGPEYALMCALIANPENPGVAAVAELTAAVPALAQRVLDLVEYNKGAIESAQAYLHAGANFRDMRAAVLKEVADRNYGAANAVTVQTAGNGSANALTDDWNGFVNNYAADQRTRFAAVASDAAASVKFVNDRQWTSKALLPVTSRFCFGRNNSIKRRGGTNLVGLDEWKAEDTESAWQWRPKFGFFGFLGCKEVEIPIAWGEQTAFTPGMEQDASGAKLGNSPMDNPAAHAMASSSAWTNYTGMPPFYDLSKVSLESEDPRLRFEVRLERSAANTRTSDGASAIKPAPHLNNFSNNLAGGVISAVATSEVYFERPWFNTGDHSYSTGETVYVVTQNQWQAGPDRKTRELGSLFNPYWQVHLASNDPDHLLLLQRAQGSELPR